MINWKIFYFTVMHCISYWSQQNHCSLNKPQEFDGNCVRFAVLVPKWISYLQCDQIGRFIGLWASF